MFIFFGERISRKGGCYGEPGKAGDRVPLVVTVRARVLAPGMIDTFAHAARVRKFARCTGAAIPIKVTADFFAISIKGFLHLGGGLAVVPLGGLWGGTLAKVELRQVDVFCAPARLLTAALPPIFIVIHHDTLSLANLSVIP